MYNNVQLDTGETVTAEFVRRILYEELAAIQAEIGDKEYDSRKFDNPVSCSTKLRWGTTSLIF